MKATIYKANGKTFKTMQEVELYATQNNFVIDDTDSFSCINSLSM